MTKQKESKIKQSPATSEHRPPVVVVMGHIDHGKSTLLDYIRETNVAGGETGGITQHISAYQASHTNESKEEKLITFLDTPGHEAFSAMRRRGAKAADIAILVVAANDGVKAQTLEALGEIKEAGLPFIIAINKIDLPDADVGSTKNSLVENEIYIEGYGGDIPAVEVSAKSGDGINELLNMILLVADLEELGADVTKDASGVVIEGNLDERKGISGTLIIKDGTLKSGEFVIAGETYSPTRIMENFLGERVKEAGPSEPVKITGFNNLPKAGEVFSVAKNKKEALSTIEEAVALKKEMVTETSEAPKEESDEEERHVIPVVIKADTAGTRDAVLGEIKKIPQERVEIKILKTGTGTISEDDVQTVGGKEGGIVVGFNTRIDKNAQQVADSLGVEIKTFGIIYELTDWIKEAVKSRTPKIDVDETHGKAKILKLFGATKGKSVLGARADEGELRQGDTLKILRRDTEIGRGKVLELRVGKDKVSKVEEGAEFGIRIETRIEIAPGDYIESFKTVKK